MLQPDYDILIIGAGPAGLMTAIQAYAAGTSIAILERMHTPAIKLKMTGKGRCNVTNAAPLPEFIAHFGKNGRFLKYAFNEFFNTDLLDFLEKMGLTFKLERGERYFPENDDASEIAQALLSKVSSLHIPVHLKSEVTDLTREKDGKFTLSVIRREANGQRSGRPQQIHAGKVVIATGGKSYPRTGSDGSGYQLAATLGHTIIQPTPALVPLETSGPTAQQLQGLSLKNVNVTVWANNKKADEMFGEMLFTDFGVSGPIILSLSSKVIDLLKQKQHISLSIDLKPALDHKKLDQRLLREIDEHSKQNFKSLLKKLLPAKMIQVFINLLEITADKKLNQISANERKKIVRLLKDFKLDVTGYRSWDHAIVTAGGISIREIHQHSMQSKLVPGLYFSGEVIDIDADTGGFNLQAAFSTAWVAGQSLRIG